MKYDFVTVGGSTEDITLYTSDGLLIDNKDDVMMQKLLAFEYGAKLKIEKSRSTFGGGASNAAVNLAGLGFEVAALVPVGNDIRGTAVIENFKNRGVDIRLVQRVRSHETGFTFFIVCQDSEHVGFSYRAANQFLKIGNKEMKALRDTKWIYITSLSGEWKQMLEKIFSIETAKIAWNPGGRQIEGGIKSIARFLKNTTIVQLNKDEAIELVVSDPEHTDESNDFLNDTHNLLKILKKWGPEIVLITEGKHGSSAYDGKNFFHQNILAEKKRVDTTGVGDCFGSTFAAAIEVTGGDIQKAMKFGAKNTASVISRQGAQNGLLTKKQLFK